MFMFPEPPALDHYLTDIGPSFVADGIFYHEKPPATHKFVAKQLKPIKRKVSDPLAPIQELDSHTLDRCVGKEFFYVAHPGKDDGMIFQTHSLMPKSRRKDQEGPKSDYSIFPRSPQYELWFIRDRRAKDFAKRRITIVECTKKEKMPETDDEPCDLLQPPVWWKDKPRKPKGLPVGNINDYSYQKLEKVDRDVKISEKLQLDHPRKYIPGAIHRQTNPKDRSMQDTLERADTFKVVLKRDETSVDRPPVDECIRSIEKHPPLLACCNLKSRDETNISDTTICDDDKRWQPLQRNIEFLEDDFQRQQELRELTKPFLQDLHTWYTKNKPTELMIPMRRVGKKLIPERTYSHL